MYAIDNAGVVRVTRLLPASPDDVFDAWTTASSLKQWLVVESVHAVDATLDIRVGGRFEIVMHVPSGAIPHTGEYRVVQRPSRLAFTWCSPGTHNQDTLVTITLTAVGGETELVLIHEGLPQEQRESHAGGWDGFAVGLAAYLQAGA